MKKVLLILLFSCVASLVFGDAGTPPNEYYSEQGVLNKLQDRTTNTLSTQTMGGSAIGTGQVTSVLGARRISGDVSIIELRIRPLTDTKTGLVYIGGSTVGDSDKVGYPLSDDNELVLRVDNTSDVYMSPDVGGNGVSFIYTTR